MQIAYTVTDRDINLVVGGRAFTVARNSVNGEKLLAAIRRGAGEAELIELADPTTYITAASGGTVMIKGGTVTFSGEEMPSCLVRRLLDLLSKNLPVQHLVNFYAKLAKNPSRRAIQELYTFLEHRNIPITPEGNFLAYKAVRNDWTDKHSGRFVNRPGDTLVMPRGKVCDDADIGCSYGFHAGSLKYASEFACNYGNEGGDRLVLVEIDPADVVSIPKDCQFQKLRTCRYKVVMEFQGALPDGGVRDSSRPYDNDEPELWPEDEDEDEEVVMTQSELDALIEKEREDAVESARDDIEVQVRNSIREQI